MKHAYIFSAAGGMLMIAAAPASTQPTGSRIEPNTPLSSSEPSSRDFSTKETRALMHGYAKCVVGKRHSKASEALLRNVDNRTMMQDYPSLIVGDCLTAQRTIRNDASIDTVRMTFRGDLYRYALADALVSRELAAAPVPDFSAVARLDHRNPGPAPQAVSSSGKKMKKSKYDAALKQHNAAVAFSYLSFYGECVVRAGPSQARALLLTVPDSPEEAASFDALRPALAECLPDGTTLKFGRTTLRGTIAINYYRLARAAAGASATGTAG